MSASPIRLGMIGMGPANMASTMTLLLDEPDLRYTITAAWESVRTGNAVDVFNDS